MHRIDTERRAVSLFGDGKDGFKPGDPLLSERSTNLDHHWFNGVQENICRAVEASGLVLVKGDHGQLTEAIKRLTATAHVLQPENVTPAAGATGVGEVPTLTASAYYSLYGIPQGGAKFEISQSESFAAVLHAHTVSGAAASYTLPTGVLSTNSIYFWRVSYQDAKGRWSLPSAPTGFTTGSIFQYIAQPSISAPANNANGVSVTPTITYSAFTVVGGTDTHTATQVQIASDAGFTSILHDSGDSASLTSYAVPNSAGLLNLTLYYWRVAHKGAATGYGDWSAPTGFTTKVPSGFQEYVQPGAYSFVTPPGVYKLRRQAIGAAGNGGQDGKSGGGGGSPGGTTSISRNGSAAISATGGLGGGGGGYHPGAGEPELGGAGGVGGKGAGGTTNVDGAAGATGGWHVPSGGLSGLPASPYGRGGSGGFLYGSDGLSNYSGGGGGGGGYATDEINTVPGDIFTVVVGACGTAGVAGTGGWAKLEWGF